MSIKMITVMAAAVDLPEMARMSQRARTPLTQAAMEVFLARKAGVENVLSIRQRLAMGDLAAAAVQIQFTQAVIIKLSLATGDLAVVAVAQ